MDALDRLAEQKIAEAIAAGEFENLRGLGKPLELEDLSLVDPELRGGYLLLQGANVLPEEMALKKELLTLGDLLRACERDGGRERERAELEERRRGILLKYDILMERRRRS